MLTNMERLGETVLEAKRAKNDKKGKKWFFAFFCPFFVFFASPSFFPSKVSYQIRSLSEDIVMTSRSGWWRGQSSEVLIILPPPSRSLTARRRICLT